MRFKRLTEKELAKRLLEGTVVELEASNYVLPAATLPALVTTGRALVAQAPQELTPTEAEALEEVHELCDVADYATRHNDAPRPQVDLGQVRRKAMQEVTAIRGAVKSMMKSGNGEDAARARLVHDALFLNLGRLQRMTPGETWRAVRVMEDKLRASPSTRAQLDELVPASTTDGLFLTLATLGEAVGVTKEANVVRPVPMRPLVAGLRRRMTRFVTAMLSTAKPDDEASRRRAEQALRPIAELRAARAQRNGRRAKAEAEVQPNAPPAVPAVVMAPAAATDGRGTD